MRELVGRLEALDPDAGAALRVITYFDQLVERRAGLEIFADGASVTITEDGCEIRVGDRSEWHAVDAEASRRAIDRAFVDAVRRPEARSGVLVDYAQAVRTHRLAHALTRSAAEGRPLRLRTD